MGFFTALGRLLGASDASESRMSAEERALLLDAWGLRNDVRAAPLVGESAAPEETSDMATVSSYDRTHWERKLRTILDGLPDSESQWDDLVADAQALGFDDEWVRSRQREEFAMLVRRAVADAQFSPREKRRIDLARTLIGLSEAEAERIADEIVAEAETIFGRKVEGSGRE